MGGIWCFLIGLVIGAVIGIFIVALISGAPDQDDGGGLDRNDED